MKKNKFQWDRFPMGFPILGIGKESRGRTTEWDEIYLYEEGSNTLFSIDSGWRLGPSLNKNGDVEGEEIEVWKETDHWDITEQKTFPTIEEAINYFLLRVERNNHGRMGTIDV